MDRALGGSIRGSDGGEGGASRLVRGGWAGLGLVCVGLGAVGAVLPGLPTTVFFIAAAACFARSSPRLEAWVLRLPGIGSMVRDYREGRGMPRRAKIAAVAAIASAGGLSAALAVDTLLLRLVVAVAAVAGIAVVVWRVPTREVRTGAGRTGDEGPTSAED